MAAVIMWREGVNAKLKAGKKLVEDVAFLRRIAACRHRGLSKSLAIW